MKNFFLNLFYFLFGLFKDKKPLPVPVPDVTEITGPIIPAYKYEGPQRRTGIFNNRKLTPARKKARQFIYFVENGRNTHKTISH